MVEFVKKNARYFVAGALFVVLLLILVKFTGNGIGNADDNNVAVTETVVTEEAYRKMLQFRQSAKADQQLLYLMHPEILSRLQTLATPITGDKSSYITLISQYIEQYQDINCYTKSERQQFLYGKCQPECEVMEWKHCTGALFLLCQNK